MRLPFVKQDNENTKNSLAQTKIQVKHSFMLEQKKIVFIHLANYSWHLNVTKQDFFQRINWNYLLLCLIMFIWRVTLKDFVFRRKSSLGHWTFSQGSPVVKNTSFEFSVSAYPSFKSLDQLLDSSWLQLNRSILFSTVTLWAFLVRREFRLRKVGFLVPLRTDLYSRHLKSIRRNCDVMIAFLSIIAFRVCK